MCGIAGFISRDGSLGHGTLQAMCDTIRHRGPDDEGFLLDGQVGLGIRRLSIIDLQTGHQPIANEDGSVVVVFNGEIYNFAELRRWLVQHGHHFTTASDTEVLVHLYEEEGVEGVTRLRGMFALALWDRRRRALWLARDRFGKKPLYYAILPSGLYFASELKSLRGTGIPLDIDDEALSLYFQFSWVPDPYTPFKSIRKLSPGCWLLYRAGGEIQERRYWRLPEPNADIETTDSDDDIGRTICQRFDEGVRIRMRADVPLGAFLSGGLDSSLVVASMARQSSEPVKTFSVGFGEPDFDEREYAALVAARYKTDHHEIVMEAGAVDLVPRLAHHFDEPFGDASAIPTFLISRHAAEFVKVVLTGDGGDELFGGYDSFLAVERLKALDRVPLGVRRFLSRIASSLPYSTYGKHFLRMASRPSAVERYFEHTYAPYFLRQELLQPDWLPPADSAFLTHTFADCLLPEHADALSQAMYFEATAKLAGDMLVKIDRMSMASSLEIRCPWLDHELAEYASTVPNRLKIRGGRGKWIVVHALGERLPPALLNRSKMGFGVPLATWFRTSLREFLWDHLTSDTLLQRGVVSNGFVRRLLEEHDRGRRDNSHWLWSLLMCELWFQTASQPQ
jgi:asparagine synthase (glutamine-hydrolysing)